ncbi:TPA: DNA primase, partial [Escherichia coli]
MVILASLIFVINLTVRCTLTVQGACIFFRGHALMKTKKHTSRTATKTPERDLYQLVTDRVVTAIENGVPPW